MSAQTEKSKTGVILHDNVDGKYQDIRNIAGARIRHARLQMSGYGLRTTYCLHTLSHNFTKKHRIEYIK